jgi:Holliday junction resolvasome RuvABC endonuclease subunit
MSQERKTLGVDPSSSCTGICLVENNEPVAVGIWKPSSQKALPSCRLTEYYGWITRKIELGNPDIVSIEIIAFNRSHQTTRILSRYESATIIAAVLAGCKVVELRVSDARKQILSKGNLSKQQAYDEVTQRYPDINWGDFDKGGADKTDACVIALAGQQSKEN